jgi:hypothetical protein
MANVIIVKGKSFRPVFNYLVREDKQARLLGGNVSAPSFEDAIDQNLVFNSQNNQQVIDELSHIFDAQSALNRRTSLVCRHMIIAFDPQDSALSDFIKLQTASGFMERMGYSNSSWVAFDHQRDDHQHDHIHVIAHAIDLDGKRISDSLDFGRSRKAIVEVEEDLGLTPSISNIEKLVVKEELLLNLNRQESFYNLGLDDAISIAILLDGKIGRRIDNPKARDLAIKIDGYTVAETDSDGMITFYDDELIEILEELQPFVNAMSGELEPMPEYYTFYETGAIDLSEELESMPEYYTFPGSTQNEEALDLD